MATKVLIVEDEMKYHHKWYFEMLGSGKEIDMMHAFSIEEAKLRFSDHPDIGIVVMDACVPGDILNTHNLVREMRETFKGPMIACSTTPEYQLILKQAGCDYASSKTNLVDLLLEIIDSM